MNQDALFLAIIHRLVEEFGNQAVLKGGMALRLLESARYTNDLDYVFVPFRSKKDIRERVLDVLNKIPETKVGHEIHSTSLRFEVKSAEATVQLEVSVSPSCESIALTTESLARPLGEIPRVVRVMSLDLALAHKLAAWNERRLARDLFDIYFLTSVLDARPNIPVLQSRLESFRSRIPSLRKKKMSMPVFIKELETEKQKLSFGDLEKELSPLFSQTALAGLDLKLKVALQRLIEFLQGIEEFGGEVHH